MANYKKNVFVGGKWAKKSELLEAGVKTAKIVSETNPELGNYPDDKGQKQDQDVCKVQFAGQPEALKVALNRATINALVEAFGEDSTKWQGQELEVAIDKLPGKKFPLYLIPKGFRRKEDEAGWTVIVKEDYDQRLPQSDEEDVNGELMAAKEVDKSLPF